jgi:hypothetical protein
MNTQRPKAPNPTRADAEQENAFIAEFLRERGYKPDSLRELPEELVRELLSEASRYAAGKLAEPRTGESDLRNSSGYAAPIDVRPQPPEALA